MNKYIPLVIMLAATAGCSQEKESNDSNYEQQVCEELDRCNYLAPGVSSISCESDLSLCVEYLNKFEADDYEWEISSCFNEQNCKDFNECLQGLTYCSPVEPSDPDCVEDGEPCDYCWNQSECPENYMGANDGCDCDCSNYTDPDCL